MIKVGSRSFSLAARLFYADTRDAAFFLYGWCRFCDDQIDQTMNLRLQENRVVELRASTTAAFSGQPGTNPVFVALEYIAGKYRIPSHYALELVEGMAMDVRKERYWDVEELVGYCYRVAGTVGLMMVHVMGISDEKALRHAADLGTAMQLTNIARDVLEDAAMGRVYLPLSWLDAMGVPEKNWPIRNTGRRWPKSSSACFEKPTVTTVRVTRDSDFCVGGRRWRSGWR